MQEGKTNLSIYGRLKSAPIIASIIGCFVLFFIHVLIKSHTDTELTLLTITSNFLLSIIPAIFAVLLVFIFLYLIINQNGITIKSDFDDEILVKTKSLDTKLEEIGTDILYVKKNIEKTNDIFKLVKSQKNRVQNLLLNLNDSSIFCREYYIKVLNDYFSTFKVINQGFNIDDEHISFIFYVNFWRHLIQVQKRKSLGNNKYQMVARIIHSNTVDIWDKNNPKYKEFSKQLYNLQEEFINSNGVIVRFLLGEKNQVDETYQGVMSDMDKIGVKTEYIHNGDYYNLKYDFVVLYSEQFVLKWFSGNANSNVVGTLVQNVIEDEVDIKWHEIFKDAMVKNNIEYIPDTLKTDREKDICTKINQ